MPNFGPQFDKDVPDCPICEGELGYGGCLKCGWQGSSREEEENFLHQAGHKRHLEDEALEQAFIGWHLTREKK